VTRILEQAGVVEGPTPRVTRTPNPDMQQPRPRSESPTPTDTAQPEPTGNESPSASDTEGASASPTASPVSGVGSSDGGGSSGMSMATSMMALSGLALATGMVTTGIARFGKRPDIARKFGIGSLVFVVACAVAFTGGDTQHASAVSFNPSMGVSSSDPGAGANGDTTIDFSLPGTDVNFQTVVSFTPPSWKIVNCDASSASPTCADDIIPNGAFAARLDATATLGLLNNNCNNTLATGFDLMDATTNMSSTTVFQDTNGNGQGEQFQDDNGNGVPNGAESYPDYLTRLVRSDPYPGGQPLQPIQRLYGQTNVAQTDVSLNFVTFAPGTRINGVDFDAALGYPSVAILQNTGDPEGVFTPSAITDFCTPLTTTTTTFGVTKNNPDTSADESGMTNRTNGPDGAYTFVVYTVSQPDADSDGIENALDPCPTQGNPDGWDPRNGGGGDSDTDGLPNVCDPSALTNTDEDGDGWQNRGDNCPVNSNADAKDVDVDGLGDACDPDPGAVTGDTAELCVKSSLTIGAGGQAQDPSNAPPCGTQASTPIPSAAASETPAASAGATETPATSGGASETPAASAGASGTPAASNGASVTPAASGAATETPSASGVPIPSGVPGTSGTPTPAASGGTSSTPAASGGASSTPAASGGASSTPAAGGGNASTTPHPTGTSSAGGGGVGTETPIASGGASSSATPAASSGATVTPTAPSLGVAGTNTNSNSIGGVQQPAKLPNSGGLPGGDNSTFDTWLMVIAALLLMGGVGMTLVATTKRE
jgi:hypothetical protein